jgi:hypothetical protein
MASGGVFPTEMPDELPFPIDPLDDDTAERLLSGLLPPEDAPPAYAEVARFLRAAAAPPTPGELAGQPAAVAAFHTARAPAPGPARRGRAGPAGPGPAGGRVSPAGPGPAGWRTRPARVGPAGGMARPARAGRVRGRARLVAVALAGTLAVGGLWIAAGAQTAPGLRSPTGGPGAGGSGSATSGSLRPAMPVTGPLTTGRPRAVPSDRDRATGGNGGGAAHRTHPGHSRKPPKDKPSKPKAGKPRPDKPKPPKPKPDKP